MNLLKSANALILILCLPMFGVAQTSKKYKINKPKSSMAVARTAQATKTKNKPVSSGAVTNQNLSPRVQEADAFASFDQPSSGKSDALRSSLAKALDMARTGQYQAAASQLFNLARRPELINERPQIKYILGLMMMELKLNQVAAFQFVDVVRGNSPKYRRQAIEKLTIVADNLGDDSLLNYAVSRIDVSEVTGPSRDMIHFRLGELKLKNKDFAAASNYFGRVSKDSSYYYRALYQRGLAELEQNRFENAQTVFGGIVSQRSNKGVTDTTRVAAQLAMARTYYQKQDWDAAIEAYAQIPRDHNLWHDAIFEQSWALLRAARFRSAVSNFQTLHSTYYEDYYLPESLLLRAIVYLYICKYDEMEKVLSLFEKSYGSMRVKMNDFAVSQRSSIAYFNEVHRAMQVKSGKEAANDVQLPLAVSSYIANQGDVRRAYAYLRSLTREKARIENLGNFAQSGIGQYSLKIISNRTKNTQLLIGDMARVHLKNMQLDLADLSEQAGFIRYEMINGKKETLKKKIAGTNLVPEQIDDKIDREFFVSNGYDYYPFQGEYWLDELGNYHYLGKQSCE